MASVIRLFSEGFRIFFFAAGLFGAVLGLVWVGWLALDVRSVVDGMAAPYQWHAHEMVFGYGLAAVGGFFLTAVPSWTGTDAASLWFVILVFGLWALGRAAVWAAPVLPSGLVMTLDLLFVPVLASKILSQLSKRPKPQNMVFLSMLCALWVANLLVHLEWAGITGESATQGLRAGLLCLAGLIALLGGRVTPAFTRNAMKRAGVAEADWPVTPSVLNKATMVLAVGLPWVAIMAPPFWVGSWACLLGTVQLLRMLKWRGLWTVDQPILWSLHLGMAFLALGLILFGLASGGIGSESGAIHVLGLGAIGVMTVAVMSRAALGHTGRPLVAGRSFAFVYGLIALATVLRWLAQSHQSALIGSGLIWSLAMLVFALAVWPIVSQPRLNTP
ncbi:NnrS family protein [Shimia abyssi]|uniref:Uncharacterized protein involved in response to NO n=1 Tax=Shimia abyssi TaxID=1662395 RepID=A0A2P8F9A9_9RHOB|nr:NnrS family protein [Shimia abyssi]PSL18307.1 uncharacterized protein involved in response to NO [Shimia abyssi]